MPGRRHPRFRELLARFNWMKKNEIDGFGDGAGGR